MKHPAKLRSQTGVTVIELLATVVAIGILLAIVAVTYTGVRRNQNNQERQRDIQAVYQQLEAYYVVHSQYPTLAQMDNLGWVKKNLPKLNMEELRDPRSNSYQLTATPTKNAYSYQVTASDGASCNDTTRICAHYTLTATLVGAPEKTYVKSSLN